MSYIKYYLEEHIDQISDEILINLGYSDEEIEELREAFGNKT